MWNERFCANICLNESLVYVTPSICVGNGHCKRSLMFCRTISCLFVCSKSAMGLKQKLQKASSIEASNPFISVESMIQLLGILTWEPLKKGNRALQNILGLISIHILDVCCSRDILHPKNVHVDLLPPLSWTGQVWGAWQSPSVWTKCGHGEEQNWVGKGEEAARGVDPAAMECSLPTPFSPHFCANAIASTGLKRSTLEGRLTEV